MTTTSGGITPFTTVRIGGPSRYSNFNKGLPVKQYYSGGALPSGRFTISPSLMKPKRGTHLPKMVKAKKTTIHVKRHKGAGYTKTTSPSLAGKQVAVRADFWKKQGVPMSTIAFKSTKTGRRQVTVRPLSALVGGGFRIQLQSSKYGKGLTKFKSKTITRQSLTSVSAHATRHLSGTGLVRVKSHTARGKHGKTTRVKAHSRKRSHR